MQRALPRRRAPLTAADPVCDAPGVNFTRDVVDAADPSRPALLALAADGSRSRLTFGELSHRAARLAGTLLARGVAAGDVVMTVVGNRPEWVEAMLACFRIGAVALPCAEQLRVADLRARMDAAEPRVVVADERHGDGVRAAGFSGSLLSVPDDRLLAASPAPAASLAPEDPALIVFTSGTGGTPKPIRHGQRYLSGQAVQAKHWYGPRPGELAWCTAASGWSKSARNVFVAPWLRGATALIQDARFDPEQRLEVIERERVQVLCMAPTEYRAIAKRTELRAMPGLRHAVAAGEPLNADIVHRWRDEVGVAVHDGYGQTETGALTGMPLDAPVRPGSMGRPLPGFGLWIERSDPAQETGELCVDPATVPTFFLDGPDGMWRTGDRARQDADGYLWFEGRTDDVILSAGYRIGPFEVESALLTHPAVEEAAAVAAPDEERGEVVRAVVVLRRGHEGDIELARELQEHVRAVTAPYKYPRIVDFAESLPKTPSGKIRRAQLRGGAFGAHSPG
jgi:acyl-coenzyme A synthetase/AMP-(fatty) acid ligase